MMVRLDHQLSDDVKERLGDFIKDTFYRSKTIDQLLIAPSLEGCKSLLVKSLFPRIDPSESVALLDRIDNAVSYVKKVGSNATVTGVTNAMFPYFGPMIDLCTQITAIDRSHDV